MRKLANGQAGVWCEAVLLRGLHVPIPQPAYFQRVAPRQGVLNQPLVRDIRLGRDGNSALGQAVGARGIGARQQVGQLQGCADVAASVLEPNRLDPRPGDIAEQRVAIHVDRFRERLHAERHP